MGTTRLTTSIPAVHKQELQPQVIEVWQLQLLETSRCSAHGQGYLDHQHARLASLDDIPLVQDSQLQEQQAVRPAFSHAHCVGQPGDDVERNWIMSQVPLPAQLIHASHAGPQLNWLETKAT